MFVLFENTGSKLKIVAKATLIIGILSGVIGLFVCLANLNDANSFEKVYFTIGAISSVVVVLGSIINSWLFYCIGETAINNDIILRKLSTIEKQLSNTNDNSSPAKEVQIEKLICKNCNSKISQSPCPFCGSYNTQKES